MDIDDAFANLAHVPDGALLPARWAQEGQRYRESARYLADVPYGEGAREVFDLFLPERLAKGTMVFIHGGYWRSSDKSDWSYLAAGAVVAGWAVAMPSYDLCPEVTIAQITQQIGKAIGTIADRVPGPLRITGHSAGGQLAARMLAPDLAADWTERVEKVVPISAVSDLAPLLQTQMNNDLRLDSDIARAESPIHQPPPVVPVTVWVGGDERPVFVEQARALADAWSCEMVNDAGRHHFDVLDGLRDAHSPLMRAILGD